MILFKKIITFIRKKILKKSELMDYQYEYSDIKDVNIDNIDEVTKFKNELKNITEKISNISNFEEYAKKIEGISNQFYKPLMVTIMGEFKTGKSTFINAILGEEILKSDITPATAVVTLISYGEEKKVVAHFKNGKLKEYSLKKFKDITAEGNDRKKKLRNSIKYVELLLPKKILKSITIVDTPGLNVDNQLHIQATKTFMNESDIVFWVFAYGKVASRTEITAIKELSKRLKPIAIINRIDEIDEEEESIDEIIEELRSVLFESVDKVIGISSYLALKGLVKNDKEALNKSRWLDFIENIEKQILTGTYDLKLKAIIEKIDDYIDCINESIKEEKLMLLKKKEKRIYYREQANILSEKISMYNKKLNEIKMMRLNRNEIENNIKSRMASILSGEYGKENEIVFPLEQLYLQIDFLEMIEFKKKYIERIKRYNELGIENWEWVYKKMIEMEELSRFFKEYNIENNIINGSIYKYEHSGILGGMPILDWTGEKKSINKQIERLDEKLEKRTMEINLCIRNIESSCNDFLQKNLSICDMLSNIDKFINMEIEKYDEELKSYENNFRIEKKQNNLHKIEIIEIGNIIDSLKKDNNRMREYVNGI